jgi:uncharacterized membrane protein YeaQ/YmgE (transglycosylase-associated protein family)
MWFWKSLFVLAVIGVIVGSIGNCSLRRRLPGGWWGAIVFAFCGACLGVWILYSAHWLVVGKINVLHALIGAGVVTYLTSMFGKLR